MPPTKPHSRTASGAVGVDGEEWTDDMIALFESVADELLLHKQQEAAASAVSKKSYHFRTASQQGAAADVEPQLLSTAAAAAGGSSGSAIAVFQASEQATSNAIREVCDDLIGRFLFGDQHGQQQSSPACENTGSASPHTSTAESVASLHEELRSCNQNLLSMQSFLEEFHDKIIEACDEINELRAHARITKLKRDNRVAAQAILGSVIDALVVPPDVVNVLLNSSTSGEDISGGGSSSTAASAPSVLRLAFEDTEELGAQFMDALRRLHGHVRQRLHMKDLVFGNDDMASSTHGTNSAATSTHASPTTSMTAEMTPFPVGGLVGSGSPQRPSHQQHPSSSSTSVRLRKCKAFRDMTSFFADLLIFVCIRIRGFLATKVQALSNPRTNFVAKQEHVLRGYKLLFRFMRDATEYLRASVVLNPNEYKSSTLMDTPQTSTRDGMLPHTSPARRGGGGGVVRHDGGNPNDDGSASPQPAPRAYGAGSTIPIALLMGEQRKPFIPYRLVKALYEDLKQHYMVTLSRIYSDRVSRYILALSGLELGNVDVVNSGGDKMSGGGEMGGGSSTTWAGLSSLIWGGSSTATASSSSTGGAATSGPSYSDHLAQFQSRTKVPVLSQFVSRDTLNSATSESNATAASQSNVVFYAFQGKGRTIAAAGGLSSGVSSPPPLSQSHASPYGGGSPILNSNIDWQLTPDQLSPFQLGTRDAIFCRRSKISSEISPPIGTVQDPEGIFHTPIIPHLNRLRSQHHAYEETYRSLNVLLQDIVCHEYLFLLDVFGADSWELAEGVFRSTFQLVVDHASDKMILNKPRTDAQAQQRLLVMKRNGGTSDNHTIDEDVDCGDSGGVTLDHESMFFSPFEAGNKDLCGLLTLLRTTLILRTNMRFVRRVNFLDSLYASQTALLWPAIHAALTSQIRSLRSVGNGPPYSSNSRNNKGASSSRSSSSKNSQTTAPSSKAPLPPASSRSLRIVHPLAQAFVEVFCMSLQLLDLGFMWKAERLHTTQLRLNSAVEFSSPSSSSVLHSEDEFASDVAEGVAVLKANLGILRLEALRVLRLPSVPFYNYYYYVAFGNDPDVVGNGVNSVSPGSKSSSSSQQPSGIGLANKGVWERRAMAAVAPVLNNLHYILTTWEERLEGGAPTHTPLPRRKVTADDNSSNAVATGLPNTKDSRTASDIREKYHSRKQQLTAAIPSSSLQIPAVSPQDAVCPSLTISHGLLRAEATLSQLLSYSCAHSYTPSFAKSSTGDAGVVGTGLPTGIESEWIRLLLHSTATACSDFARKRAGSYSASHNSKPVGDPSLSAYHVTSKSSASQAVAIAEERALAILRAMEGEGSAKVDTVTFPTPPSSSVSHISSSPDELLSMGALAKTPLSTLLSLSDDYRMLIEELEDQRAIYARIAVSVAFQEVCELLFRPVAILGASPSGGGGADYYSPGGGSSFQQDTDDYLHRPPPSAHTFLSRFRIDHLLELLEDDAAYVTELFLVTLADVEDEAGSERGGVGRMGDSDSDGSHNSPPNSSSLRTVDIPAIMAALLRVALHCHVVIDVCAAFTATWESGIAILEDLSLRYLVHPAEQKSSLAQSCLFLLSCNSALHEAIRQAVSISQRIRVALGIAAPSTLHHSHTSTPASSRASSPVATPSESAAPGTWGDVTKKQTSLSSMTGCGVLRTLLAPAQLTQLTSALPPQIGSIKNLVVSNQRLLDKIREVAAVDVPDTHPDL